MRMGAFCLFLDEFWKKREMLCAHTRLLVAVDANFCAHGKCGVLAGGESGVSVAGMRDRNGGRGKMFSNWERWCILW